jgi:hypothetical protein
MNKRDIENLLFQVLQEKQTKAHPCLEYLTKRLCCLYFLQCSTFSGGDVVTGGDKDKTNSLEEKYKALIGPLEKQIEDGIKWEVETKQVAAEETKKIMESELLTKEDQAAALARINENRKKINTDEIKASESPGPIIKQDQINKSIENPLLNDKGKISLNKLV